MAGTGAISISAAVSGLLTGSKAAGPITINASAAVANTTPIALASGFNTISVPTGATAALIVPASGNTVSMTLKGVTDDTGLTISKTNPMLIPFDSTLPSIGITAGATTSVEILFI